MDHPDGWIVTNSNGGHSEQPGWYYNLQADPSASVRAGSETHAVTARELDGAERDEWWEKFVAEYTEYTGFQEVAHRQIAMLVLTRT
jgi:deazaflavin-dependent oxidoreductase (nitroreductase family)